MKFINLVLLLALFTVVSCSQSAENKNTETVKPTAIEQKEVKKPVPAPVAKKDWTLITTPQLIEKIGNSVDLSKEQTTAIQTIADGYNFDNLSQVSQGEVFRKISQRLKTVLTPEQYEVFKNAQ